MVLAVCALGPRRSQGLQQLIAAEVEFALSDFASNRTIRRMIDGVVDVKRDRPRTSGRQALSSGALPVGRWRNSSTSWRVISLPSDHSDLRSGAPRSESG